MHYPIIDIQAEFEINRPKIAAPKIFPHIRDGRTDGQTVVISKKERIE